MIEADPFRSFARNDRRFIRSGPTQTAVRGSALLRRSRPLSDNESMFVPGLAAVAQVISEVGVRWAVAGGWAIDLWLGEQTREHHDIEVVVGRADQRAVHSALRNTWELFCLDPPGSDWRLWGGHPVDEPAFQIQARRADAVFDIFTESMDDHTWQFRRDHRITRPVADVVVMSDAGIPIVRPEIQLLYMAKSEEAKNQHDFVVTRPRLGREEASWLAEAIRLTLPAHRWLAELPGRPSSILSTAAN